MILTSDALKGRLPQLSENDVRFLGFEGILVSLENVSDGEYVITVNLKDSDFVPEMWETKRFPIIIKGYDNLITSTAGAKVSYDLSDNQILQLKVHRGRQ